MVMNLTHQGDPKSQAHIIPPKLGLESRVAWICLKSCGAEEILAELSVMYTQHSTLILAQVSPHAAVKMSSAIWFCNTTFLISWTSVFNKEILGQCHLQLSEYIESDSIWHMKSLNPTEQIKIEGRWLFQWNTLQVHLSCKTRRVAEWPRVFIHQPRIRWKLKAHQPIQPGGNHGHRWVPRSHWVPFEVAQCMLSLKNQSVTNRSSACR